MPKDRDQKVPSLVSNTLQKIKRISERNGKTWTFASKDINLGEG